MRSRDPLTEGLAPGPEPGEQGSAVPKSRFPTNRVYAQTEQPTLRLITSAGGMNPATGYQPGNYIVFASLAR